MKRVDNRNGILFLDCNLVTQRVRQMSGQDSATPSAMLIIAALLEHVGGRLEYSPAILTRSSAS
jgi:hypothetical protein